MKVLAPGVCSNSQAYFHTPSIQARQMFFYPLCAGHFFCDSTYYVDRRQYDSFLVMYVERGSGYVELDGIQTPLKAGSFLMLDCYLPHRYGTTEGWETYWLHFDGVLARQYYDYCTAHGNILKLTQPFAARQNLVKLFEELQSRPIVNEAVSSRRITALLTEFLCEQDHSTVQTGSAAVESAIAYISENAHLPITLDMVAQHASLSRYHFVRTFKKETGFTPHEYLLLTRINMAKYLLRTGKEPVKAIAYRCGFQSESSFCTAFKKIVSLTPMQYREGSDE